MVVHSEFPRCQGRSQRSFQLRQRRVLELKSRSLLPMSLPKDGLPSFRTRRGGRLASLAAVGHRVRAWRGIREPHAHGAPLRRTSAGESGAPPPTTAGGAGNGRSAQCARGCLPRAVTEHSSNERSEGRLPGLARGVAALLERAAVGHPHVRDTRRQLLVRCLPWGSARVVSTAHSGAKEPHCKDVPGHSYPRSR